MSHQIAKEQKLRSDIGRLLLIVNLLFQNPKGLTIKEIAEECEVSEKTIRRDIKLLERANYPFWNDHNKWGIITDRLRPPVCLSLPQAVAIFIASRLLLGFGNAQNPNIENTLKVLCSIVPPSLQRQIQNTISWMAKQPVNSSFVENLEKLAGAWIENKRVRINYRKLNSKKPDIRKLDPYFIQPSIKDHGNYLIAHCHKASEIRVFKIERIINVEVLDEKYKIPADFDPNKFLDPAWGIITGEVKQVKLKFSRDVAPIALETYWHASQKNEVQSDGSVIVTFQLTPSPDFEGFILGWGNKVEVLEPAELRRSIKSIINKMGKVYAHR